MANFLAAQTIIFSEDFQNGFPAGWQRLDLDMQTPASQVSEYTEAWIIKENPEIPGDSVASSTSYYEPAGTADKWLITPFVTLGAFGNFLSWNAGSHDPSYPDSYRVLISTGDSLPGSFTDTLLTVYDESASWTMHNVNLSEAGYDGQSIFIAFVNITDDGFKLYIDDVQVAIEDPAGIDELPLVSVGVFPNPAQDFLTIESEETVVSYAVRDLSGRLVLQGTSNKIEVSQLESGHYLVEGTLSNGTVFRAPFKKL